MGLGGVWEVFSLLFLGVWDVPVVVSCRRGRFWFRCGVVGRVSGRFDRLMSGMGCFAVGVG